MGLIRRPSFPLAAETEANAAAPASAAPAAAANPAALPPGPATAASASPSSSPPLAPPPQDNNPHAIPRRHATVEALARQASFRGFQALSQKTSPFKRQLSLRMNELPSTVQRKTDFPIKNAGEPGHCHGTFCFSGLSGDEDAQWHVVITEHPLNFSYSRANR